MVYTFIGCCLLWVQKKCNVSRAPFFQRYSLVALEARAIAGRLIREPDDCSLKYSPCFVFQVVDILLIGGGCCQLELVAHCKCAWGKFHQLQVLPPSAAVHNQKGLYNGIQFTLFLHY